MRLIVIAKGTGLLIFVDSHDLESAPTSDTSSDVNMYAWRRYPSSSTQSEMDCEFFCVLEGIL